MNNTPTPEEKIKRHSCGSCGADMVFDPQLGKLACPYCDTQKTIATNISEIIERDLSSYMDPVNQQLQPLATDAMQVSCDSCGATVTFVPPTIATSCDFCAAKLVAQPKSADPLVAPEGVIPFSVASGKANSALKKWTASRWFAPNALKTMASHNDAESVYIPYWTFDADTVTNYTGQRGDDYQETEHYTDSDGKSRTRTHTRTNWYSAHGQVQRHFDDTPIPATISVLPDYLTRLNWDFGELVSYDPGYLSGHKAQTYQVSLGEGFEKFQTFSESVITGDVKSDIGGDRQVVNSMDTDFSNVTFKHILVPVYAGAYRFNKKTFQVVINGRTGEVFGERPYSSLKIGCLIAAIIALILIIVLVISAVK
jgi:hypothetical protein